MNKQSSSTLAAQIDAIRTAAGGGRFLLGICGPPGSGKSTLAQALATELNKDAPNTAVIVPMDGFHLDDETLADLQLLPLKGVPATFDAARFVALLHQIAAQLDQPHPAPIFCPAFDRTIESTVPNAIEVRPDHQIILIEGNYLLLTEAPWRQIRTICDQIWYLDVPLETLSPRLLTRHQAGGKTSAAAARKVATTDLPNAQLVAASKERADRYIRQ